MAFRDILEQFDDHRVTQQLMNEDINSWKSKDPEWTAHARSVIKELYDIFLNAKVKYPTLLENHGAPFQAITETIKQWIAKVKIQKTIPRDGEDLWKNARHSLTDDTDWDVSHAAKELLVLNRDKYAEIHGAPKEKEKKKAKPTPTPPPKFTDKKARATAKFKSIFG